MSTPAERLAQILDGKSLRQMDLCRLSGVSVQLINQVLHGRRELTLEFAKQVSRVLGVSPGWLLFGEERQQLAVIHEDGTVDYSEGPMPRVEEGVAEGAERYARGPEWEAVGVEGIGDGEVAVVELRPGRRVLRRVWQLEGEIVLESLAPGRAEAPSSVRRREIKRAWRLAGAEM